MEQRLQNEDASHLNILKICHYVMGGLSLLSFLGLLVMSAVINMTPSEMSAMAGIYFAIALFSLIPAILNLMTASALGKRNNTGLIYTTSVLNCLNAPIGTTLGIFTFIVLSRNSVKALFNPLRPSLISQK